MTPPNPTRSRPRLTEAENDALGARVQKLVLAAMRRGYEKHMRSPTLAEATITCGVAAIIEGARLLHAITTNQDVTERIAFAYLRGAIRGLDQPIKEDGTPFTGAFDG